ncbi:hypothetical protein [Neobacillus terrae]|nr:hypothetical protein [Neobacillus terrae]NHM29257.1 hypothetical protein [Neobacillus terrae]
MNTTEHLTQKKLQEILLNIYFKGIETDTINVKDIIEEIKKQVLADSK